MISAMAVRYGIRRGWTSVAFALQFGCPHEVENIRLKCDIFENRHNAREDGLLALMGVVGSISTQRSPC